MPQGSNVPGLEIIVLRQLDSSYQRPGPTLGRSGREISLDHVGRQAIDLRGNRFSGRDLLRLFLLLDIDAEGELIGQVPARLLIAHAD